MIILSKRQKESEGGVYSAPPPWFKGLREIKPKQNKKVEILKEFGHIDGESSS